MILSTKGRYAVMAMVDLAIQPAGKPVTLAAIAERQEIPLAYLEQIFARLKRSGLVKSVRGPGGGYTLARAADAINVAEIMVASEEAMKMTRCDGKKHEGCMAPKTRCLTHDLWEGLSAQIQHYLSNVTLADVCGRKVKDKFPRSEVPLTMFAKAVSSLQSPVSGKAVIAGDWQLTTGDFS